MYLFHNTTEKSLKSILQDEGYKIKCNEGDGIYKKNNFIYFSCIDKLNTREIYAECILYFHSKLLYCRSQIFFQNFTKSFFFIDYKKETFICK